MACVDASDVGASCARKYTLRTRKAPHLSVVDRSVVCTKIYVTNTESPTLDAIDVGASCAPKSTMRTRKPTPGDTSVRCNKEYAANTESQNTWCNRMATSEERLRITRERDRLRRQMELELLKKEKQGLLPSALARGT